MADKQGESYLSIHARSVMSRALPGDPVDTDDPQDYDLATLRVMAFEKMGSKGIVNNAKYRLPANLIIFPIDKGVYDFVFIANEPDDPALIASLEGVSEYDDLNTLAFSQSYFDEGRLIPMISFEDNVEVVGEGSAKVNGGAAVRPLTVNLTRMAVRMDVTLQAPEDFTGGFNSIVLSNIPDAVPLTSSYSGPAIGRNTVRTIAAAKFAAVTPSGPNIWAIRKERVVMPANDFNDFGNAAKAVDMTIRMNGSNYSPTCKLKINSTVGAENYTLPKNTYLDFNGRITYPLEVNIAASEWGKEENDWAIGQRILNVSHSNVSITDFNGARISFWSNMPVVKVLDEVQKIDPVSGAVLGTAETNRIFNSIACQTTVDTDSTDPERFRYTPTSNGQWSGSGYMDLVGDGWVEHDGVENVGRNLSGTYVVTLSAENEDGSNVLRKQIRVTIAQASDGYRFRFYSASNSATGYVGAFWKNDQLGERIITGQHARTGASAAEIVMWSAKVDDDPNTGKPYDWVVLSTTPSFDGKVGTANPNDAENYHVVPNLQKGELGDAIRGKGRIYFRIGLTGKNPNSAVNGLIPPRYATVSLTYKMWGWNDTTVKLYLRQGEDPDFVFEGRPGSRAFMVYNMTHREFMANPAFNEFSKVLGSGDAVAVDFPTKVGAHFQWARLKPGTYGHYSGDVEPESAYDSFGYRALSPRNDKNAIGIAGWGWGYYQNYPYLRWDNGNTAESYKPDFEICPNGYHRPNDGRIDGGTVVSQNSTQTEANASEWRASIFANPMIGDGNELYDRTNPQFNPTPPNNSDQTTIPTYYKPQPLPDNLATGFYADGYFDRRPLEREWVDGTLRFGVTLKTTHAACWGTVAFNKNNNKSLFFPAAGLREYGEAKNGKSAAERAGVLMYPGTGYYMTASAADMPEAQNTQWVDYSGVWSMQLTYDQSAPVSYAFKNGYSMRCVKDQ